MDWELDCDTDLADFAGFQACHGHAATGNTACLESFDRATPCGLIDLDDFAVLAGQLTGPGAGCGDG